MQEHTESDDGRDIELKVCGYSCRYHLVSSGSNFCSCIHTICIMIDTLLVHRWIWRAKRKNSCPRNASNTSSWVWSMSTVFIYSREGMGINAKSSDPCNILFVEVIMQIHYVRWKRSQMLSMIVKEKSTSGVIRYHARLMASPVRSLYFRRTVPRRQLGRPTNPIYLALYPRPWQLPQLDTQLKPLRRGILWETSSQEGCLLG